MTSTIHADKIMNYSGDQDSGINLQTNDQVKLKTANTDRVTVTDATTSISNDLNVDSNTLFVDASTNKVHIGNTSDNDAGGLSVMKDSGSNFIAHFRNTNANPYGVKISAPNGDNSGYPLLYIGDHASTEYLKVQNNGYVTKPLTPAFDAGPTSAITHGTNPIAMTNVRINNGNHFNSSNGTFTAPTTGTYFFYCNWIGSNSTTVHRFYFRYNGNTFNETHARIDQSQGEDYNATSLQFIKVLNANDTMAMSFVSDNNSSNAYSDAQPGYQGFGGFLLY